MSTDLQLSHGTSSLMPSTTLGRSISRQVKRSTDAVVGRGEVALTTDTVRAGLTYSALNNVGTLVTTAKSLMDVAPEGAAHYDAIINAYSVGAANAIARFQ